MTNRLARLMLVAVIGLVLAACGSDSGDVPSLEATPTSVVEEEALDDEAKVMAFTQCMRDQGIQYMDPVVDSDGNVQPPKLAEGVEITRAELAAPYGACSHHLEGISFGRERRDASARLDEFVGLATCLRDKGYDLDDPTAETLNQWLVDFRVEFDWDDPDAKAAYEECSSSD